ncbi:hypothetical protein HYU18_03500 [Candidatus Woesearchaeota archaeon]|nr:hypothetical protein [Candidatus Woesearchaeota archaeon]
MTLEHQLAQQSGDGAQIRILCADISGSLVHLTPLGDKTVDYLGDSGLAIHKDAVAKLQEIRDMGIPVVLITGTRQSHYESQIIPVIPHAVATIEDGALVYWDGKPDSDWDNSQATGRVALQRYRDELIKKGVILDEVGRRASIRVIPLMNEARNLEALVQTYPILDEIPPELRRSEHMPYNQYVFQYVAASAGKERAVQFIMNKLQASTGIHYTWANVAAFGNDPNDENVMEKAALCITIAGTMVGPEQVPSHLRIQRLVERNGGIFVPKYGHQGTVQALSEFVDRVRPGHQA